MSESDKESLEMIRSSGAVTTSEKLRGTELIRNDTGSTLPAGTGNTLSANASGEPQTENVSAPPATSVSRVPSSDGFREGIETDGSVSMNLLNQSAEYMLSIVKDSNVAAHQRIQAANALAAGMQTQVNMVKALTSVIKLGRTRPGGEGYE